MKSRLPYDQFVQRRVKQLFVLLTIAYCVLGARLFYIQVVKAHYYQKIAAQRHSKITLLARRGAIYDRTGKKLAVSVDAYDIFVNPSEMKPKQRPLVASKLAPLIGWPEARLLAFLNGRTRFAYIQRRADMDVWEKVKSAKLPGVGADATMKRVYPGGQLAAHILGFTNVDGYGVEGIERAYDKVLRGRDGYHYAEMDAKRQIIPTSRGVRVEPVNGKDIVLTIDATLQHSMETELEKSYTAHSAAGASAVMLDPKTGEILAMANLPTFDPNHVDKSDAGSRRDRAVTDLFEPGSTLKTITASAAIEERAITVNDTFFCSGSMRIGKRTVRCSLHHPFMNGHGACNVAKMLKYSCNMAAAQIGLRLGKEKLYKYESAFGLYEKPGAGLPGELLGWHDRWQDWADVRTANIAFGQGIAMTPLQLAKAYSAVANGGIMMRPFIVKEIRGLDGKPEIVYNPKMIRRVVSAATAALVKDALHNVVVGGTGKTARVDGYNVAGKTGSAQKAVAGGYVDKFIASFIGFLPVTDPRVVILVAVDEPKGTHWGATVAAPVFQRVAREAMWRMKVPPDGLPKETTPPVADDSTKKEEHRPTDAGAAITRPRPGG